MRSLYALGLLLGCSLQAATTDGPTDPEVLDKLQRGNKEYVAGHIVTSHLTVARRVEVSSSQKPFAACQKMVNCFPMKMLPW